MYLVIHQYKLHIMNTTNFKKISTREARIQAIHDMKEEKISAQSLFNNQSKILRQPVITYRMGWLEF